MTDYVLDRHVEAGNTVVAIEHNLDVVKNADWIIDFGPKGGDRGGEIVADGADGLSPTFTSAQLKSIWEVITLL